MAVDRYWNEIFDEKSVAVIVQGCTFSAKLRSDLVGVGHLFLASLVLDAEFAKFFNERTSKTVKDFARVLEKRSDAGVYRSNNKDEQEDLYFCTQDFKLLVQRSLYDIAETHEKVDFNRLLNHLLDDNFSELNDIFAVMGIRYNDLHGYNSYLNWNNLKFLSTYTMNMSMYERDKGYDNISGRDDEINQIIEVFGRRKKNNALLIGEPGVGKTAIVEGLVKRINGGKVPYYMDGVEILKVDNLKLLGTAKFRGELEERIRNVLTEVSKDGNRILFFDEMHVLASGGGDSNVLNMLKPYISNGDIRIIGATTLKEYHKYIEDDAAFDRRLEIIRVDEPSKDLAIQMVKGVMPGYSKYHNCRIEDEAITTAVSLSDRYIKERKLPDKAIYVLDSTAARLKSNTIGKSKFTVKPQDIAETIGRLVKMSVGDISEDETVKLVNLEDKLSSVVIG